MGARSQIPENVATDLLRAPLNELNDRLIAALESGSYDSGRKAIGQFSTQLRNAVRAARESGPLRPVSARSEFERCHAELVAHKWNGAGERDPIIAMVVDGERSRPSDFGRS